MAKMYLGNQPVRIIERSKNQLIPFPYENYNPNPWEIDGILWTVNADGSVTANGTATSVSHLQLFGRKNYCKPNKIYTLKASPVDKNEVNIMSYIGMTKNGNYYKEFYDTGKGTTFTFEEGCEVGLTLWIGAGVTVKNLTFYPMLNEGEVAKPFESYNQYFRIRTGANIRNPANLIPFPYFDKEGPSIWNDITYSHLQNGVVVANGNTNNGSDYHSLYYGELGGIGFEVGKTYTLTGSVGSNGAGMWRMKVELRDENNGYILDINQYNTPVSFTIPKGTVKCKVLVIIGPNNELKNKEFYPMLVKGTTTKPYLIID